MSLLPPAPAESAQVLQASVVEFVPAPGSTVLLGDRRHGGRVRVAGHPDGLAVTERHDVDAYLLGIREVPFSWHEEALEAQVIAARTYLAWTLGSGRSSSGRRYDYDICATDACQVYAGLDAVLGPGGEAWRAAVEETADLILVHEGEPAQALYSSTSGGRTRSIEDVFTGASPVPYLRAVDSPAEESPFVEWSFTVPRRHMEAILAEAGVLEGALLGIATEVTEDGGGPWRVVVEGDGATVGISTWELRGRFNRAATALYPDSYPVRRPDGSGRRYPQVIMSPSYRIEEGTRLVRPDHFGPPRRVPVYRVGGRGWGHLVGMSQYGAEAMARAGSDHDRILAHYYGGLTPVPAGDLLPDEVSVGLLVGQSEVVVRPTGPVSVLVDGSLVAEQVLGTWTLSTAAGSVTARPPVGLGTAPRLAGPSVLYGPGGRIRSVAVGLSAPAEVRAVARRGHLVVFDSGWVLAEPGRVGWAWEDVAGPAAIRSPLELTVSARSPQGEDEASVRVLPAAE